MTQVSVSNARVTGQAGLFRTAAPRRDIEDVAYDDCLCLYDCVQPGDCSHNGIADAVLSQSFTQLDIGFAKVGTLGRLYFPEAPTLVGADRTTIFFAGKSTNGGVSGIHAIGDRTSAGGWQITLTSTTTVAIAVQKNDASTVTATLSLDPTQTVLACLQKDADRWNLFASALGDTGNFITASASLADNLYAPGNEPIFAGRAAAGASNTAVFEVYHFSMFDGLLSDRQMKQVRARVSALDTAFRAA